MTSDARRSRPEQAHYSIGRGFRTDIEGLRGLAVLLVVAFHAGIPWLSGGFVGVDVFFVISGYLITALLTTELVDSGTISLATFFARRVRRLLPAAAVVLCATLALSWIAFPPMQMVRTALAARASAAYMSNIYFLGLASDYFSGDVRLNPTLHTWSLAVEEQFYLVWPALLLIFARISGAAGGSPRRRIGWGLTAVGMASFLGACWYVTTRPSTAFYSTPLRAWEFACGGLASLVVWHRAEFRSGTTADVWAGAIGWIGLGLVVAASICYSPTTEFPGVSALVPVLGASMLLVAGALPPPLSRGSVGDFLGATAIRWIGRRSYSWYLWHWPILVLGEALLSSTGVPTRIALALIALLLADVTYRFVETPTRARHDAPYKAHDAWRTIGLGVATTAVLIFSSEATRRGAVAASHAPLQIAFTTAAEDRPIVYGDGCVNDAGDERVHVCRYGSAAANTQVMLFGDSHAVQWLPAIEAIAFERGWTVLVIAKTRCATADVIVYVPQTEREAEPCARWRRDAMDTIQARHPAAVVLSNAMVYIRWPRLPPETPAVSVGTWEGGMLRTVKRFRSEGMPVIVIQDTPQLRAAVLTCLAQSGWLARHRDSCGMARSSAISEEVAGLESRVVSAVPGSFLIDLTDILCPAGACTPIVGGIVAYQDGEHLTATMTRLLAPMFVPALDSAVAASISNR